MGFYDDLKGTKPGATGAASDLEHAIKLGSIVEKNFDDIGLLRAVWRFNQFTPGDLDDGCHLISPTFFIDGSGKIRGVVSIDMEGNEKPLLVPIKGTVMDNGAMIVDIAGFSPSFHAMEPAAIVAGLKTHLLHLRKKQSP